ncbi:MAG: CDP-alcohol phosphatidyltransferase family protein [Flexilinea sp.]
MKYQNHTRINDTILGPLERPALQWLAKKMPVRINPDHLTAIGFAGSIIIFAAYWLSSKNPNFLWLASLGFVINWFGDSLDGTLARYRKIERPHYGFFVDHIIDSVSILLIYFGLGLSPYVRFEIALIGLIGYLLMSIYTYLITYINGVFKISYAKIGPTEVRLIGILINVVIYFTGSNEVKINLPIPGPFTFFDLSIIVIAIVFYCAFIIESIRTAVHLDKKDSEKFRNSR